MNKIIIIGANGQLGSDLYQFFSASKNQVISVNHSQLPVENSIEMAKLIKEYKPDVVINTSAFHQLDKCELNPEYAILINSTAPHNLAKICNKENAFLVHFSTDYVFDGSSRFPYTETDCPNPLNVYGKSKLMGELLVQEANASAAIIRISALFGKHPCRAKGGLNFVQLMLKKAALNENITVVDNEWISPTSTLSIAKQTEVIINKKISGIIHATSEGYCSWFEFAEKIFELSNQKITVNRAKKEDMIIKTPRPGFSVLENKKLKSLDLNIMPDWQQSLKEYLQNQNNFK